VRPLIVDTLASGKGTKYSTQDVIGAGPRTIAGVLEKKGLTPTINMVESYLKDSGLSQYDVLLVSGMTSDIRAISRTVRKWKKTGNKPVIIGGPASSDRRRILMKTGGDIAVTGEGEYSLFKLLEGGLLDGTFPNNLEKVRGISYRNGKKIKVNHLRPVQPKRVFDDFFPSTDTITDYRLYKSARVYVEVVRGCSNFHRARIGEIGERCNFCEQCTESNLSERYYCPMGIPPGCGYCSVPSLYGPPKSRAIKLIVTELEKLLELGVHRIVLSAPDFLDYQRESLVEPEPLTNPKYPEPNYEQIENLLHSLSNLPKISTGKAALMIENLKASLITERAASILGKYLKGTSVSVGFETGSDHHGRLLGRPDNQSEILDSIKRLKNVGLKPYVYFIHGLPGQTLKTANDTVKIIGKSVKLGAERIILYRFLSLPASTFTSCPSGSPAAHDPISKRIYDAAHIANLTIKDRLVEKIIKVVVAEKYFKDKNFWISYPMLHGPVMLLEADNVEEGDVLTAKVTGVASDRMVYGVALD
jgi:radical SAM superfamily enzyme YgiQ (UPF0313 family)